MKLIILAAFDLFLTFSILHLNPFLFSKHLLWSRDELGSRPIPVFSPLISAQGHVAHFIYRNSSSRHGFEKLAINLKLKKAWQTEGLNFGAHTASKSSPAIDQDGIFVGGDMNSFSAFDFQGHLIWQFHLEYTARGVHGTAALDEHFVYFGAYNGRFYCLDKKTGRVQWVIRLGDSIGSSPLLYKDELYISVETFTPPNGYVVKLKASDGSMVWKSQLLGEQAHSSVALEEESGLAFVGANSKKLFAIDSKSGNFIWQKDVDGEVKSTPAVHQHIVYVTDRGGFLSAFQTSTGNLLWKTHISSDLKTDKGSQSCPTIFEREKMIVTASLSGLIVGVRMSDGKILWQKQSSHNSGLKTSATGTLQENSSSSLAWIECDHFEICALNPRNGKVLTRIKTDAPISGSLEFFDGAMYFATDPQLERNLAGTLLKLEY